MKINTPFLTWPLTLLFSLILISSAISQSASTDFDADGYSDLTLVSIGADRSLSWNTVNPKNGTSVDFGSFGVSGNHLMIASWTTGGAPTLGSVSLDSTNSIVWKIQKDGSVLERKFGKKNHLAISGADFDGNGIADAAVASLKSKKVAWTISYNLFDAGAVSKRSQILFGSSVNKVFYARPQSGRDWLGVITQNSKGQSVIQFKNTSTGKTLSAAGFPSFLKGSNVARPIPIRQINGTDLLALSRVSGGQTRVYVYRTNGKKVSAVTFPVKGDLVVGNFNDSPGYEIAIKNAERSEYFVFNPIDKNMVAIAAKKGIAVDSVNLNTITAGATPAPQPDPRTPPGDPNFPGVGTTVSCTTVVDINTLPNMLYKNENIHGGRGRTWLDQGHRMKGVRRIYIAGLNGKVFGCFGLYACDNPYGCRYYQAMCKDPLSNSQFINAAVKNGDASSAAYVTSGNGTCYAFTARKTRDGNIRK